MPAPLPTSCPLHAAGASGHAGKDAKGSPMTSDAAARIQSAEAKQGSGGAEKGGFAARAQVRGGPRTEGQQKHWHGSTNRLRYTIAYLVSDPHYQQTAAGPLSLRFICLYGCSAPSQPRLTQAGSWSLKRDVPCIHCRARLPGMRLPRSDGQQLCSHAG